MSESGCCDVPGVGPGDQKASPCPTCQRPGRNVDLVTVKSLLTPGAMHRLEPGLHFQFCAQPDCDTVYFGGSQVFVRNDLAVAVFQKDPGPTTLACYCFGYTRGDLTEKGAGAEAVAKIREFVKAGKCACETKNPQGSCCLANVTNLTKSVDQTVKGA